MPWFLPAATVIVALALPARAQEPEGAAVGGAVEGGAQGGVVGGVVGGGVELAPPTSGDEATERLDALWAAQDYAAVTLRSREWAARFPDHFGPRYYKGLTYTIANQFDEAVVELRASVTLLPGFAEGHAQLGAALALTGDDAAARPALEQALALDPGHVFAAAELRELETRARLAGAPPPPMPADGTPERIAWDVVSLASTGALAKAWTRHIDTSVGDALFADSTPAERPEHERAFVEGVVSGYEKEVTTRLLGWELAEGTEVGPDTATVAATLLLETIIPAARMQKQIENVFSPTGELVMDPAVLKLYRSLPREEVERSFHRMADRPTRAVATLRFDLVRRGDAWKVADATFSVPDLTEASLSTIIANQDALLRAAREARLKEARESLPFAVGYAGGMCGGVGCVLAAAGGLVALIARATRR